MNARTVAAATMVLSVACGGAGAGAPATSSGGEGSTSGGENPAATSADGPSEGATSAEGGAGGEPEGAARGPEGVREGEAATGKASFSTAIQSSFESPFPTCGPEESYGTIAAYICPDGSVPLGGNLRAGAQARVGSMGSHEPPSGDGGFEPMNSHIVDRYEVPCPSGPVTVYICMYHCDER